MFRLVFLLLLLFISTNKAFSNITTYDFMIAYDKNYSDGVFTVRKIGDGHQKIIKPSPKQLISFLENNVSLKSDFEKVSGINFNDLKKLDLNRNELTLSDLILFKNLNDSKQIESKINKSPIEHCQSTPKLILSSWDEPASDSLEIKTGENRYLPPGSVLHYTKITIDENATLTINNGRQGITQIKSDGDCIINGKIESKNFRSGTNGNFEENSPDGDILSVPVQENNIGGRGGLGGYGSYKSCIGYPSTPGGSGAAGTSLFGGGGGGSGYVTLVAITDDQDKPKCAGFKGYDAIGQDGGKADNSTAFGGNGGGRTPMRNGGYLFLKCNGKILFSKTSSLDFSGTAGVDGTPGNSSCGGGGGGGPGGLGGFLIVNTHFSDLGMKMNFNGGTGGKPGKKGADTQHCGGGEDGNKGEDGFSGSILFSNN